MFISEEGLGNKSLSTKVNTELGFPLNKAMGRLITCAKQCNHFLPYKYEGHSNLMSNFNQGTLTATPY